MTEWNCIDKGAGRALVLLHGGGSSANSWLPVIDQLAQQRRVIAFDFPGFGDTPAVRDMAFTMDWAMQQLAEQLNLLGVDTPVDIAGNSMGGWMALEAAKRGMARSVDGPRRCSPRSSTLVASPPRRRSGCSPT